MDAAVIAEHATTAAICALCELEQGHRGIYTDTYGTITVKATAGRYIVSQATGWYAPACGHYVDDDWSDGITEIMAAA